MALLPSTQAPWHSNVVWWLESHSGHGVFGGKVWKWKANAQYDCQSSPFDPNFWSGTELDPPPSSITENIFCSGLVPMRDGRLFIAGGTETAEYGLRGSAILDPNAEPSSRWSAGGQMNDYRWYPTATTMADGRVLLTSGSRFEHTMVFGGKPSATDPPNANLNRFASNLAGFWDPTVTFSGTPGVHYPEPRSFHAAVIEPRSGTTNGKMVICGGERSDGVPLIDVWEIEAFDDDVNASDVSYVWSRRAPSNPLQVPEVRRRHAVARSADGALWVIGGLGRNQANTADEVKGDAWFLIKFLDDWTWVQPTTFGTGPGARYGHTAIYDVERTRILVFGGASGTDGIPTDNSLYALNLNFANPFEATWEVVSVLGTPPPARLGHTMLRDPNTVPRTSDPNVMERRIIIFGGKNASGHLNDAWHLWINETGQAEWREVTNITNPQDGPSARAWFGASLGGSTNELIIYGGETASGVAGGQGYKLTIPYVGSGYDYVEKTWSTMLATPSATGLTGQTMLIHPLRLYARKPETVTPGVTSSWQSLPLNRRYREWYPFTFVLPDASIFLAGPSIAQDGNYQTYKIDIATGVWSNMPATGAGFKGGSAVMYRPGQIMKCGSRDTDPIGNATTQTAVIEPLGANPNWRTSSSMSNARVNHNLVVLPNGEVLVVGGTGWIENNKNQNPVHAPQLWHPPDGEYPNGVWYPTSPGPALAADPMVRGYHSTTLLLPDGRVLSGGGFADTNPDQRRVNIYCPPYLFKSDGTLAPRPMILGSPTNVLRGTTFTICVQEDPASISSACLIAPGAVTHGLDMNQRYVPLTILGRAGTAAGGSDPYRLFVRSPSSAGEVVPGYYLLFVVGSKEERPSIPTCPPLPPGSRWTSPGRRTCAIRFLPACFPT